MKLVISERESAALERYLATGAVLATSRVALVEVPRATAIANPAPAVQREAERLLDSCLLVGVTDQLLRAAAELASPSVRTLDAIHLASALRIGADELLAYDRRLATAAQAHALAVVSPGAPSQG